ncbi:nif11-like leader peptide domain protein [Synechococcus sp. BIOS-U3-1]|nr:nif11-like leader peptide domain protein [Synechococcus sp. BIOS-U3-1]
MFNCTSSLAVMTPSPVQHFLEHLGRDPVLQVRVQAAATADEVAQLAQDLGYPVAGSDLLMLSGRSTAGVRVIRVDHPGEYPGRYY